MLTSCLDDPAEVVIDDFWETIDAGTTGISADSLEKALEAAQTAPNFKSLLVIRQDKIVGEWYFNQTNAKTLFHLRSITKNFTSALVGVSLQQQLITDPEQSVGSLSSAALPDQWSQVSLRHLLNMTSGLQWNENEQVLDLINHRIQDPLDFVLQQPVIADPGTQFNYNSLTTHLLASILSDQAQSDIESFTRDALLTPLGITRYVGIATLRDRLGVDSDWY